MTTCKASMNIDTMRMLEINAADLLGCSIAILGIKGGGKSNTAAVLMEEMLAVGIPILVVDTAGEYWSLQEVSDAVQVLGQSVTTEVDLHLDPYGDVGTVAETVYLNGYPAVLDVSGYDSDLREALLLRFFTRIWRLAAIHRIPMAIFLEEAHNYIPQRGRSEVSNVLTDVAAEGRKRGLSIVMMGQRAARMNKDVLSQADICFLHRQRHPHDIKVYCDMIPRAPSWVRDRVYKLRNGEALVLIEDRVLRTQIRRRQSADVGATPSMGAIPQPVQMSLIDAIEAARRQS
jgi:uncharacterized protein